MKKQLLTVVLILACLLGLSQPHIYQFSGTFNEAVSGPALSEVLAATCTPAGVNGNFSSEIITTSAGSSGSAKPVFLFNQNAGLSYNNASGLGITGTYTIHILYRLNNYTQGDYSFQRVIDFANGSSDNGLHTRDNGGNPTLCNVTGAFGAPSPSNITLPGNLVAGQYYLITLVRDGATKLLNIYLDGNIVLSGYDDTAGDYLSNGTNPIIFFRDDVTATYPCESGAGAVRYVSLNNTTSTSGQVTTAWLNLVSSVLPVSLNGFSAQKNNNNALLQWKTATEINTAYFNVERSYDGQTFTTINKVNAKGVSSSTYSYDDIAGLASNATNTYYRLKIVDNNGNYKYSSVVRLANNKEINISVFPNPASDNITISGLKRNDIVKLLSIDGKILSQQVSGVQSMTISIEKYKPGTYVIQVQNDKEVSQQKIIKY